MKLFSYRRRPTHLGSFPLEKLRRRDAIEPGELASLAVDTPATSTRPSTQPDEAGSTLAASLDRYLRLFLELTTGKVAEKRAPLPEDAEQRGNGVKGACYFLDASMVGICALTDEVKSASPDAFDEEHGTAVVILVEHPLAPSESTNRAAEWTRGNQRRYAWLRSLEIGNVIAGYIRNLGHSARAHGGAEAVPALRALAVRAGLARIVDDTAVNPFVEDRFELAAVTTSLTLKADLPLSKRARSLGVTGALAYWLGWGGTVSRLERFRRRRRPSDASRFPMETIKRVAQPTTLIFDDEVPRVPKRAGFFERARRGDLGEKALRESKRFATKHPLTRAMVPLMQGMVPLQDGDKATNTKNDTNVNPLTPSESNETKNARAVKSLAYFLGTDLAGICEAKNYSWYSHASDGTPIEARHPNAIVFLIDQGHETMEAASGDDWMSGAQSMRGYLRGSEITGIVADHIRRLGYSARAQTNADSEVLHIPLVLLAGLGELSRIGELVLNPFVGPRFKSAVVTTDMPLEHDQPIDFGLQDMCNKCMKCARECPVNAISYGEKVIFNGYEMWKPDVERCARYRVTNPHGSACGRCMKMCPYTNEGLLIHRAFLKSAIHIPFTRRWIAKLDDFIGNGRRNLIKKWWWDHEWLPQGWAIAAPKTNERELHLGKDEKVRNNHRIAYYHASDMPAPDAKDPHPIDRKRALEAAALVETADEAVERRRQGRTQPEHYRSTPNGNGE